MANPRLRLLILCEDSLQQEFIERLADRWAIGPRQRTVQTAPAAQEKGVLRRRQEFAALLRAAGESALNPNDPRFVVVIPCWHVETWIAWLCGHRPVDERTSYKPGDPHGAAVAYKIKSREYSARLAAKSWTPPAVDEAVHLPSLASARQELRRLGVPV